MPSTNAYETLTASGKGLRVTDRPITDFTVDEIQQMLRDYLWIAFQQHPVGEQEVADKLAQFGNLVQNDRRKGVVLKLDGSRKDEVLLGEGFMPLHRDGALMGNSIALVAIYCAQYQQVTGGGRTFISDIESACKEVSKESLDLIRARGIEGRPVDTYYTAASDAWHPIPGFIEVDGKSYLNVGFPYREDQKPSWLVRIPGVDDETFRAVFDELTAAMMSPKYCYYHEWTEGEVLLLDNLRTLHGREAFQGHRALSNMQVVAA